MKDYYRILDVGLTATDAEVKRAYRKLARRYHPDVNPGKAEAEARFKEICEAHAILTNPERRRRYDLQMLQGRKGAAAAAKGPAPASRYRPGRYDSLDLGSEPSGGGFRSFGDIFSDLFGQRKAREAPPTPGRDIRHTLELAFDDAVRGVSTEINVNRRVACESCSDNEGKPAGRSESCPACGGSGKRRLARVGAVVERGCERCLGTGFVNTRACSVCHGIGSVTRSDRITVGIPPGVDSGSTVRIAGKGDVGINRGRPGDLLIITKVQPHAYFSRKGDNLYIEVPISFTEAILGARIRVPTVDGPISLAIPPGTQNGQQLRLRGRGVQHLKGEGRGDQFVSVRVVVPQQMDEESLKLLRQFHDRVAFDPRTEVSW